MNLYKPTEKEMNHEIPKAYEFDIEQIRDIARELAHQIDWLSRTSRLGGGENERIQNN